jgi:hypothetical protein
MNIGAERMRFKAEIRWNGAAIASQTVQAMDLEKVRYMSAHETTYYI